MEQSWVNNLNWDKEDIHLKRYDISKFKRSSLQFDKTPGVHTLLGPRRIGKSTQFKLWIRELLKFNAPKDIAYINAERFENWKEFLPIIEKNIFKFLFIDEITSVTDWPRTLKILADEGKLENITIWITGSNSFDLKNLGERLPGRKGKDLLIKNAILLPLTFKDFHYALNNKNPLDSLDLFMCWGGYPMAVSEAMERPYPSQDLMQELLDVTLGETSRRHRSPKLTALLAERLWITLGSRISYNSLAKYVDAGSHPIIRQYIEILEGCYSIFQLERINHKTGTGIMRKDKKIYFLDPLCLSILVSWSQKNALDPMTSKNLWGKIEKQGALLENLVAGELFKKQQTLFYDEINGQEIDFIYRPSGETEFRAVEVKRSSPDEAELKGLGNYKNSECLVLYPDDPVKKPIRSLIEKLLE